MQCSDEEACELPHRRSNSYRLFAFLIFTLASPSTSSSASTLISGGQLPQRFVGRLFLLIEQFDSDIHAQFLGPGDERAVPRYLVMLDRLRGSQHPGVAHGDRCASQKGISRLVGIRLRTMEGGRCETS